MSQGSRQVIETASAWIGPDVVKDEYTYELTSSDVGELLAATDSVSAEEVPLERISMRNFELPRLGPVLKRLAVDVIDGRGFALVRGFPVDAVSLTDLRTMYFGASTYVGLPVGQNLANQLIGDVRDEGEPFGAVVRGYKSNDRLSYHNDSADLVGLLCVKAAKEGGVSKIVSAHTLHNVVLDERPDLLEVLYDVPFYFSWKEEGPPGQNPLYWSRIFSSYEDRLTVKWSYDVIRETAKAFPDATNYSERQKEAIEYLDELANREELCLDMHFRPGDLQLLNNHCVLHSRTSFIDHDDPAERRHLLRVWLNQYNPRRLSPDFTNRYDMLGDTTMVPKRRLFPVEVYDTW